MAQVTNRSTLDTALTDGLNDIFSNRGKQLKKIYPSFLKEKKLDQGQWIDYDRANFGKLSKKGEQEPLTYDQLDWGNKFEVAVDEYGLAFRISRAAYDDLKGGGYGVDTAKIASLGEIVKSFRDSAQATQEDLAAQLILNANSTTVTSKWLGAGRDGVALAGTHTLLKSGAGPFSNSMTAAALDYYQLQSAITLMETIPTDEGFYTPLPSEVVLVVGPYNRHRAYELVNTKKKPDTNENTESALNDFNIKVIVNPYLGSTFDGWAVLDPNRHKCFFLNRQEPVFDNEGDFETAGGKKFSVYMRCKVSFSSAHGFIHNAGPA
jgi:hypothetical protein